MFVLSRILRDIRSYALKERMTHAIADEIEQHTEASFSALLEMVSDAYTLDEAQYLEEKDVEDLKKIFDRLRQAHLGQWAYLLYSAGQSQASAYLRLYAMSPFAGRQVRIVSHGTSIWESLFEVTGGTRHGLLTTGMGMFVAETTATDEQITITVTNATVDEEVPA